MKEAIDSVLAQSTKADEIIVVDDGSSDNPETVTAAVSDVRLLRQSNQGLAAARNTGWQAARSKYILFLDADDRLCPGALATNLAQFARRPDCGFVYGAYRRIDEAGNVLRAVRLRAADHDPYRGFLATNLVGMHATVLYRRDCLEQMDGFDASLRAAEDYDIYLRLSRHFPVASTPECLAEYRLHDSNMSSNAPRMLATVLEVMRKQEPVAREKADWYETYRRGLAGWKSYYANMQLGQFSQAVISRSLGARDIRRIIGFASIAPFHMLLEARNRMQRRQVRLKRAGPINFGDLRRTTPISDQFGLIAASPSTGTMSRRSLPQMRTPSVAAFSRLETTNTRCVTAAIVSRRAMCSTAMRAIRAQLW